MSACIQQNFVLRPEPCKRENASQCQCTDHIEPVRDWHGFAKPAHIAHIIRVKYLFMRVMRSFLFPFSLFTFTMMSMLRMVVSAFQSKNNGAGRKEQQSLEEGMCNEMEH